MTARPHRAASSVTGVPTDPASAARDTLLAAGASDATIKTFLAQLDRVVHGETGLIAESDLSPINGLPDAESLPDVSPRKAAELLAQAVVIKLNGGLGTSMGLTGPKSLLPVKQGLTFLDVIARQVLRLRADTGAPLPLLLMNSFSTQPQTLDALASYPDLQVGRLPLDFLQNKVPKLRADDLTPVSYPPAPELEWAPPGHGDLYPALATSGVLDALLTAGLRYAFVSNSDNLGATLDVRLLSWFAAQQAPFAMEAAERTGADRKGGHLALRDGALTLRESAQTAPEDLAAFQDVTRHRYFNTNNLWLDLQALATTLRANDGVLDLPLIVNAKTVDPRDPDSTKVVQLESAMGSALSVWPDSVAIRVPRSRLSPVKTTNDLLAVRSDAFVLTPSSQLTLAAERAGRPPLIDLDARYFKLVHDFDERFAAGVPSLLDCERLTVTGDVRFGADIAVHGTVELNAPEGAPVQVPDGAELGEV